MIETRRFIITAWKRVGKEVVPTAGHLRGAGNRSVSSIQRKVQINLIHNLRRAAAGRFNWWGNLNPVTEPNDMRDASRQMRRKQARQDNKAWASSNRRQPVAVG